MSFLLLPLVRMMINGPTPLHIFEAPTMGTGKSLLASLAAIPTLGIPTPITHMRADCDDSEWAKKITSKVMSGAPYFLIDNWVATALHRPRRRHHHPAHLGRPPHGLQRRHQRDAGPRQLCMGHNLEQHAARGRRRPQESRHPIGCQNPRAIQTEPRAIQAQRHPGLVYAPDQPGSIARCCLIIVSSWVAKGKPSYSGLPLGTFESWSRVMGGILESAGVPGFNPSNEVITSGELIKWNQFVVYWYNQDTTATAGSRRSLSEVLHLLINYVGDDTERKALFIDILEGRSATMDARVKRLDRRLQQLKDNTFQIGEVRVQLKYERDTGRSLHLEKL